LDQIEARLQHFLLNRVPSTQKMPSLFDLCASSISTLPYSGDFVTKLANIIKRLSHFLVKCVFKDTVPPNEPPLLREAGEPPVMSFVS
jgi:hypothetical protein